MALMVQRGLCSTLMVLLLMLILMVMVYMFLLFFNNWMDMFVILRVMMLMLVRDMLFVYNRMMLFVYDLFLLDDNRFVMMMYMLYNGVGVLLDLLVDRYMYDDLFLLVMTAVK